MLLTTDEFGGNTTDSVQESFENSSVENERKFSPPSSPLCESVDELAFNIQNDRTSQGLRSPEYPQCSAKESIRQALADRQQIVYW